MEVAIVGKLILSIGLVGLCGILIHVYNVAWLKPEKVRSKLRRQGIKGPAPSFLLGNIGQMKKIQSEVTKAKETATTLNEQAVNHDWVHSLFPFFKYWKNEHGPIFMCSIGTIQLLYVSQPDVVKEISLCTSVDLGKPTYLQRERGPLLGQGILTSNGASWAHQRKIIAPELYMDKVKGMINLMLQSATSLVNSWETKILSGEGGIADVRIDEDMRSFSADVISRACFGSNYSRGQQIFLRLRALQQVMSNKSFLMGLPGLRYLPTKNNREIWRLEKEIRSLILKVVKERKEAKSEKDLLQMIIEGANSGDLTPQRIESFIVDNCKNVYFAGHETTAMSACWTLMLLASNPEWQDRVRAEVLEICGGSMPDADMLRKMKLLTMVIQEALRLYPTVVFLSREVLQEMKFGDINVPKGVNIWIPVISLHRETENWGADADIFNPERFANGTSAACKQPHLYLPFGAGPRYCAGQNLAMVELKIIVSMVISNFSLSIPPTYRHAPVFKLVIEPEHGVNLLMKKI